MRFVLSAMAFLLLANLAAAQTDFQVTGTPIPATLLRQNYGPIPAGIGAYDLDICNVTDNKQSLVSSKVYQALAGAGASLEPIGRDIMLTAIIQNQAHTLSSIMSISLNATTSVLSVLAASRHIPSGLVTGAALGSLAGQQVISSLKPILSADQVEKYESQVLEPALVLDGGSCVERTVFVLSAATTSNGKAKVSLPTEPLSFHIH